MKEPRMHEVWQIATKRFGANVRITLELMPDLTWMVLVANCIMVRGRTLGELKARLEPHRRRV